jgi:hypothetical protein
VASPTRTRARSNARATKKASEPPPFTQEELDIASAQENAIFQQAQVQALMQRVGSLRVELNRANRRIAELENNSAD